MVEILPARVSDLRAIAVGCLYILTGNGSISWPGSGRAKPSLKVVVDHRPYRLFRRGDATYFPFWVRWDLWHKGVVPVLRNKAADRCRRKTLPPTTAAFAVFGGSDARG